MSALKYKGYVGSIEYDLEEQCLHGRVLFINDVVSYGGDSVKEIVKSFKGAVDSYLKMCKENNVEPDQPFSGTFNVRVGQQLHKKLAIAAAESGSKSLNDYVKSILEKSFETKQSIPTSRVADKLSRRTWKNIPSRPMNKEGEIYGLYSATSSGAIEPETTH